MRRKLGKTPDTYKQCVNENTPVRQRRKRLTVEWARQWELKGPCFVVGEVTDLERTILMPHAAHSFFPNPYSDLDFWATTLSGGPFGAFCLFEVIEHLMNPLSVLLSVRFSLAKDGILLLSTDVARPRFLQPASHFHEFHRDDLMAMIAKAGLEVIDERVIRVWTWHEAWHGFRPLLRWLFWGKKRLLALRKKV